MTVAPQPTSTIFGLNPTVFYAIITIVVVAVVAGAGVAIRASRKRPKA
jgi:hypothetical protein